MKQRLARGTLIVTGIAGAALVVAQLLSLRGGGAGIPHMDRPWLLAPAAVALAATVVLYAYAWRTIVCALDPARPRVADSIAAFAAAWLGRHVPTGAPYVAGKVILANSLGHGRSAAAASIVYENLIAICVATAIGSALLLAVFDDGPPLLVWAMVGVTALCGLAALCSPVAHGFLRWCAWRASALKPLERWPMPAGGLVRSAALLGVAGAWNGVAFGLTLAAFEPLSAREFLIAGAVFNLAGAAGVAAVVVPSGLGVREAVIVALLQYIVPVETAIAAALVARVLSLPLDLAFGAAGGAWLAATGRTRESPARTAGDPVTEPRAA